MKNSILHARRNGAFSLRFRNACILWSLALLPLLALSARAQVPFTWTTNHQTITITGYTGSDSDVQIPGTITGRPVTAIGASAFYNCFTLASITIPDSVASVGDNAFSGCTNLETIAVNPLNQKYSSLDGVLLDKNQTTLIQCPGGKRGSYTVPGSVRDIGDYGFYQCVSLTEIVIPSSVKSIGDYAFYESVILENVTIPSSVTRIGTGAFYGCASLAGIVIPNGVTSIGTGAFSDCTSLASFVFPTSITSIGDDLFSGCTSLGGVTIPNSVTSIGDYAFLGCTGLTNVAIPNSVISIGYEAFANCTGLASVTLPNKITTIGNNVFAGCSRLNSMTIPATVTSIGDYAFSGCASLATVVIPKSVLKIGSYAFSSCTGLVSYSATNGLASIGTGAFSGCTSLSRIALPANVTAISDNMFAGCSSLSNVTIPRNIRSIGNYAFSECTALTNIAIPATVGSIGDDAYAGCSSLRSITLPSSVRTLGDGAFSACVSLTSAKLSTGLTVLSNNVFAGCVSLTGVTIPGSVKSIGGYAFSGCSRLASVVIPNSVLSLGNNAFSGCASLTRATMGSGLTSIGDYAFSGCVRLAGVTLPAKITSTGNYTFQGCAGLTSITIPLGVTSIGDYAFSGCASLAVVTIPTSVTGIGAGAFLNCVSLTSVIIPSSVASIGYQAFSGCTGLTGAFFTGNAPAIVDAEVFLGAPNVKAYFYPQKAGWGTSLGNCPTVPVTAPIMVQSPASQWALAGGKAAFSVSVFGPQPVRYQWQFNGTNIAGATSSALTLASAQGKNAGNYTVVATNTYGSVTSSPAVLSVANVMGNYRGLITAGNYFDNTNSGAFVLTVTSGGAYSAKLTFPSQTTSASGKLALSGAETGVVATTQFTNLIGGHSVAVSLVLALDSSTAVSGSMTAAGDTNVLASLGGAMAANPTNLGLFNVAILSATTNQPAGYGYGSVAVSTTGARITLTLADQNAVITALTSGRLKNGAIPVFAPLYAKKGFLSGWLTLTNQQVLTASPLAWHKEAGASKNFFAEGFNQWANAQGGVYTAVTNLAQWGTSSLAFDGQPLEGSLVDFANSSYSRGLLSIPVTAPQQAATNWTVTPATGLVKMSGGGLNGSGILVPATAPYPGIYGFATNIINGVGAVHSIDWQPGF